MHEYSKKVNASVAYIRADIAEQLAAALRDCLDRFVTAFPAAKDYQPIKDGYAALSAWEASKGNQRTATDDEIVEMTSREAALGPEDASNTAQQEEPRNDG
jgi:hypothetical protein